MITNLQFAQAVESIAPLKYQYEWDNSGYNIVTHEGTDKIFVCLDVTLEAIKEAVSLGCDTILSHHPVFFHAAKALKFDDPVTAPAVSAVKNNLNVYCAHTSCDCSPNGLNLELAKRLNLDSPKIFAEEGEGYGIGFIGELLSPVTSENFAKTVKEALKVERLRYVPINREVKRVVVCGGACGDMYKDAALSGADAIISGEAKHNEFIEAKTAGIMLIDAGHYETEIGFLKTMSEGLQNIFESLKYNVCVEVYKNSAPPYKAI